jgi:hypothetical protein
MHTYIDIIRYEMHTRPQRGNLKNSERRGRRYQNIFYRNRAVGFGLGSSGSGQGKVARSYEHRNQRSGSIKRGEFLEYRAAEHMARMHNMACGIHYCPNFFKIYFA